MESPIEVVRRFCSAWSDDVGTVELAAFFTDDAVYHNIPLTPVTGREDNVGPSADRASNYEQIRQVFFPLPTRPRGGAKRTRGRGE